MWSLYALKVLMAKVLMAKGSVPKVKKQKHLVLDTYVPLPCPFPSWKPNMSDLTRDETMENN